MAPVYLQAMTKAWQASVKMASFIIVSPTPNEIKCLHFSALGTEKREQGKCLFHSCIKAVQINHSQKIWTQSWLSVMSRYCPGPRFSEEAHSI